MRSPGLFDSAQESCRYDTRTRRSRFLEVDPVEGGSANDYDYANAEPVVTFDLSGTRACRATAKTVLMGRVVFKSVTAAELRVTVYYNTPGKQACSNTRGAVIKRRTSRIYANPFFDAVTPDGVSPWVTKGNFSLRRGYVSWGTPAGQMSSFGSYTLTASISLGTGKVVRDCGVSAVSRSGATPGFSMRCESS